MSKLMILATFPVFRLNPASLFLFSSSFTAHSPQRPAVVTHLSTVSLMVLVTVALSCHFLYDTQTWPFSEKDFVDAEHAFIATNEYDKNALKLPILDSAFLAVKHWFRGITFSERSYVYFTKL